LDRIIVVAESVSLQQWFKCATEIFFPRYVKSMFETDGFREMVVVNYTS